MSQLRSRESTRQTVNTDLEYHIFLTPNGDCKGLYVSQRTPTAFEVRELGGGTSNIEFSYRIVALRKNFENIRMAWTIPMIVVTMSDWASKMCRNRPGA